MRDFIRRLLFGATIAIYCSLFWMNGNQANAESNLNFNEWIWPTNGEITDTFGTRRGMHKGIDIAANPKTPIYAVSEGTVSKSYYSDTYGHVVFIKHNNKFETVYAHLNKRRVIEGQTVQQGEIIGEMGNTGDSSGVHLHFEVHENEWTYSKENAIDPDQALGSMEIGQEVYALHNPDLDNSIETAGSISSENETVDSENSNTKVAQPRIHVVQAGETLWSIAQAYETSIDWLVVLNNLQEKQIDIGQELEVRREEGKKYMVNKGDTLMTIARKTGKSVEEIKKKNHLANDTIYPNQMLIVE